MVGIGIHRAPHFEAVGRLAALGGPEAWQDALVISQLVARPQNARDMLGTVGEEIEAGAFVVRRFGKDAVRADFGIGRGDVVVDSHIALAQHNTPVPHRTGNQSVSMPFGCSDQAARAVRRRRAAAPTAAKPTISSDQLAGSGTALGTSATESMNDVTSAATSPVKLTT